MIRVLLSLAVLAFFVLCAAAMWWGWHNRARRQSYLPALPPVPESFGEPLLPPLSGVYVSTTTAGDWQDRIVVGGIGFRSVVQARLHAGGLLLDRTGAVPLWIPADALVAARADRALAGKVMGIEGLLVVRWRLSGHLLDTGVRGDDKDVYDEWIDAIHSLAARDVAAGGTQGGDDR
jgi:hypothetical protein